MSLNQLSKLGPGSVLMTGLKSDAAAVVLPDAPHFVVRASHEGPFSLTTLALDLTLILQRPNHASGAWISQPIGAALSVGQRLGWSIFSGFKIPALVAVLVINQKPHYLGRKEGLVAGGLWAMSVELQSYHLS